ncbi:GNAT family N-acetyltransferase [Anaerophaga thermohalophila]|jgi:ribosomal-protein-serine acetyltransferase|uniref:GNAT family N-acetyltransferase n=1 Tax=Anaerophaga thermohalophila TaxID=177400 RepID=UPI0002E7C487|nr:GNAT family protein [Anaerophaga thermohalophila]
MTIDRDIELKPLQRNDAGHIFKAIDDSREHLRVWLPFVDMTHSEQDSLNFVNSVLELPEEKRDLVWTIWYKSDFAGLIGTKNTDYQNQRTEIGYWLTESFQGKGIMIRSVQKVLGYLFNEKSFNRIEIKVAIGNKRSRKIPEQLGFSREGVERDAEKMTDGTFADAEVFSLLKKEFG